MSKGKEQWESLKEKGAEVIHQVQSSEVVKEVGAAAKKNPKEVILATVIALGFLFSFFTWVGALVVGICAALYVPWSIRPLLQDAQDFFESRGYFASAILAITLFFLLVHVFWFAIGALAGLSVKLLFQNGKATTPTDKK